MLATAKITKRSTLQEVLEFYPSAQRGLFRRFHIGGFCNAAAAASYFAGHGFKDVRSMTGGIDACSQSAGCQK